MQMPASPQKRYQAFILDADNTIFDFDRAEEAALRDTLRENGIEEVPEDTWHHYHRINDDLWKLFEQGKVAQEEIRVERFRQLLAALPASAGRRMNPQRIGESYIEALSEKGFLLPHALPVLQRMSSKAPLLLLSNGIASVQRRRIGQAGIAVYFKDILISAEVGLAKPDPSIFDLAIEKLQCARDRVLCVGDSPSSDIRGGRAAGLDTCWYGPVGTIYPEDEPEPLFRISDLRQLLDFLPSAGR